MQLATQPRQRPGRTAADRRFKGYKPESAKAVRVPKVKEDATLRALKDAYRRFGYGTNLGTQENDQKALEAIEGIGYTAKDVEKFSLALAEFQDETWFGTRAGMFLSALVNNGQDDEYVISVRHLRKPLNQFGYMNRKNVTIKGDFGLCLGEYMEGGSIRLEGNAEGHIGTKMKGGTIIIGGDLNKSGFVGSHMGGGTIVVEGNAGNTIGWEMKGGEIQLNGPYAEICKNIQGGQIFHKGVQIWPQN